MTPQELLQPAQGWIARVLRLDETPPAPALTCNRLLPIETVADLCGVSLRTVRRWIDRDGLPVHYLPGTGLRSITRIAQDDLDAWLDRHRHDSEVEKAHAKQTMRLDGIRFMSTPPESSKPELDSRRRFRPRVAQKD